MNGPSRSHGDRLLISYALGPSKEDADTITHLAPVHLAK